MTAHLVTWMEGVLWASGEDFDASRPINVLAALWMSEDAGLTWSRVDDPVGIIPLVLFDDGRRRLATNAAGNALMFQE